MRLEESPKAEISYRLEVRSISSDQAEPVLDGCCCDESVRKADTDLSPDSSSSFRHLTVDGNLPKRSEQRAHKVRSSIAGGEFGSGDDRIVQSVASRSEFSSTSQMVDEDVGVDQNVSHGPIRLGWALLRRGLRLERGPWSHVVSRVMPARRCDSS